MTRRHFTPGFNAATLHDETVGDNRFIAMMSTNPAMPFQVATYNRMGFIDPRSIAVYQNPADAIAEVDRRTADALNAEARS